ncbi:MULTISPECIES: hypothetical protein [unclassified Mesorhizobium]|uniref:DUF7657 domain-containing protein n=1 Tax=unclassified Mesorhizobium TaxID=325217 RepID=UPI000BAFC2BF|nr:MULTISPECIES: hypothetical protein [unclassified Mesorhizobium]PBC23460.1 hypothetical protein CK226_10050 [Mesorhizobium sp. WSM4311]TRD06825.1 hypothetical protein FJV82_08845 [Mesorhizobium sp. WSM4305]
MNNTLATNGMVDGNRGRLVLGWIEERTAKVLLIALLVIAAVYVALALTPSHYAMGLHYLGLADARPLFLTARPVRSDEWIVLTPLFQTAVRGGFSTINQISPYHESLKGFWALPILDWSLVFKPQLWGFWILPPAYAYSLYFAVLWVAFLVGYTILLRQLGADLWFAAFGAGCLLCSHMVQVWWTSNAPPFAFAPWPLIAFLLPIRPWLKLPLLFWMSAVWVFGLVYPPFLIPTAFSLAVLLLAFRRDMITPANIAVAILAAACLGISFVLYFGDLIPVMQGTVYPGQRDVSGGGVAAMKLLAYVFPFFTTAGFFPLMKTNECDVAVVSTLLPLTVICFVDYRSLTETLKSNIFSFSVVCAGLLLMFAWMAFPVSSRIGEVFLWNKVQPGRMAWGFGLLLTISLIITASRCKFHITKRRVILFFVSVAAGWAISKIGVTYLFPIKEVTILQAIKRGYFEWVSLVPFAFGFAFFVYLRELDRISGRILLCSAYISGAITFGTYNPFQQAYPIFDIPETRFLASLREQAKANPNGWAVLPGIYGALFSGAGVPAINHTLTAPQLSFFRKIFPAMPEAAFNQAFNRYAFVIPSDVLEPKSTAGDRVLVPIAVFKSKVPPLGH